MERDCELILCGLLEDGGLGRLDVSESPFLHHDFEKKDLIFGGLHTPLGRPPPCGSTRQILSPEIDTEGCRTVRGVQHGFVSVSAEGSRKE